MKFIFNLFTVFISTVIGLGCSFIMVIIGDFFLRSDIQKDKFFLDWTSAEWIYQSQATFFLFFLVNLILIGIVIFPLDYFFIRKKVQTLISRAVLIAILGSVFWMILGLLIKHPKDQPVLGFFFWILGFVGYFTGVLFFFKIKKLIVSPPIIPPSHKQE